MDDKQTKLSTNLINRHRAKLQTKLKQINTPDAYIDIVNQQFNFLIKDFQNDEFNYQAEGLNNGNVGQDRHNS